MMISRYCPVARIALSYWHLSMRAVRRDFPEAEDGTVPVEAGRLPVEVQIRDYSLSAGVAAPILSVVYIA